MAKYANGTEVQLGDRVRGRPSNSSDVVEGIVVGVNSAPLDGDVAAQIVFLNPHRASAFTIGAVSLSGWAEVSDLEFIQEAHWNRPAPLPEKHDGDAETKVPG